MEATTVLLFILPSSRQQVRRQDDTNSPYESCIPEGKGYKAFTRTSPHRKINIIPLLAVRDLVSYDIRIRALYVCVLAVVKSEPLS
jgi:hypothetical protein